MPNTLRNFTKLIITLVFSTTFCFANEENSIERKWDFGIGLGYGNSSNPFAGADDIPSYLTLDFSIYGKKFFFDNGEFGYTFIDKPDFGLNIIATYNSERIYYSYLNEVGINVVNTGNTNLIITSGSPIIEIDSDTVITTPQLPPSPPPPDFEPFPIGEFTLPFEIPNRDLSLNLGVEFIYDSRFSNISYQITKDVIGVHSGMDMILNFSKSWTLDRFSFSANLGFHWKSAQLVDYYYGIDYNFESYINLKYSGQTSIDTFMGIKANYRISNNLSFVASYNYNRFGSSIRNSPIINEDYKQVIFTGLFYRF